MMVRPPIVESCQYSSGSTSMALKEVTGSRGPRKQQSSRRVQTVAGVVDLLRYSSWLKSGLALAVTNNIHIIGKHTEWYGMEAHIINEFTSVKPINLLFGTYEPPSLHH